MNRLMIVTTSHCQLGETGDKIGVWLEEFVGVYLRFLDRGIAVVVASPRGGEVPVEQRSLRVSARSLEKRLREAGGNYSHRDPWVSHVVVDRNLVTGQNVLSTSGVADTMLELMRPAPLACRDRTVTA